LHGHSLSFEILVSQIATDQMARALKVNQGALVQAVAPNSAAAKAGLQATRRCACLCAARAANSAGQPAW